jgi:hypothetical protein
VSNITNFRILLRRFHNRPTGTESSDVIVDKIKGKLGFTTAQQFPTIIVEPFRSKPISSPDSSALVTHQQCFGILGVDVNRPTKPSYSI